MKNRSQQEPARQDTDGLGRCGKPSEDLKSSMCNAMEARTPWRRATYLLPSLESLEGLKILVFDDLVSTIADRSRNARNCDYGQ